MVTTPINDEWLLIFYDRISNLYSLTRKSLHDTHQWAITLALALITAILTLGGVEDPYPNEFSFIIVILSFPLLIRFFIRSCLETSIQYKFQKVRDELDIYLSKKVTTRDDETQLIKVINTYYFEFFSPKKLKKIIWDNLRLAYMWIFFLWFGLSLWGGFSLIFTFKLKLICILAGLYVVFEIIQFIAYKKFQYVEIDE